MNKEIKRYLVSAGYTFITVFLVFLLADWGNITSNPLTITVLTGVMLAAIRAALKATGEYLLPLLIQYFKGKIK